MAVLNGWEIIVPTPVASSPTPSPTPLQYWPWICQKLGVGSCPSGSTSVTGFPAA
jgi:hypothetical protein